MFAAVVVVIVVVVVVVVVVVAAVVCSSGWLFGIGHCLALFGSYLLIAGVKSLRVSP